MRPSFTSQVDISNSMVNRSMNTSTSIGLKDGCPSGTVPIRRTTKEELLRAKANFREHFHGSNLVNSTPAGFIFAGISTAEKQATHYHGAGGYIAICNPMAGLGQFSGSAISIEGGPVDQFSVIRVGWMVNENLYHDNRTRLYTIWGQGVNGDMHGCYNTYCSGFVQSNAQIPLDMVLEPISVLRGTQYYVKLGVNQDKATGNWWLRYGESDTAIGYWRSSLFTHLNNGGDILRWGGMVYSSTPQLPPMGNGDNGDVFSAHFRRVSLSYESGSSLNGTVDVPLEVLGTRCYKAGGNSYKGDYWGYSFYFGGDGGDMFKISSSVDFDN